LTTWYFILSAELTKTYSFRLLFWGFWPLGKNLLATCVNIPVFVLDPQTIIMTRHEPVGVVGQIIPVFIFV